MSDETLSGESTAETAQAEPASDPFLEAIDLLKERSFKKKGAAVELLKDVEDPRVEEILTALLTSKLYYLREDKTVVIIEKNDEGYALTGAIDNSDMGVVKKSAIKKISTNNRLRKQIKSVLAELSLKSKDTSKRLAAVKEMLRSASEETADLMRDAMFRETNKDVKQVMLTIIALVDINSDDKATRLSAIKTLGDSLEPEAFNALQPSIVQDADGNFEEQDEEIRLAASEAIKIIQSKREFYQVIETIFFGLSLGSVLLLAAIGLAITFGVMGVINMAHGELIMLGAYTTWAVQQFIVPDNIGASVIIAIPLAFLISGLVGVAIERGVIRHLYGRPLETLLATFGISLILQQAVRIGISAQNVPVETPQWMAGTMEINSALSITYNRFYIIIFSLMVFFALLMVLKKTTLGLKVRAVSQNRSMAKAMGVKTEWVDALTFGLGSGVAGVAGVALSQLTNVGPNLGQSYIIDSFMVVVFGGVGNLWGTLVGAMSLGVVNKFIEPWSGAVVAKILVLVFIILFIQKKPRGLFPQKGRAAEN